MMALFPPDKELDWHAVEECLLQTAEMAEDIWLRCGITMPEGAAEEIKLTEMDTLLSETAAALEMPAGEIYRNRHRIRWICYAEIGDAIQHFASLDGGPPKQITP